MIDHSHTPVWLKCTERWKIDPNIKGSIYGMGTFGGWNGVLTEKQVKEIRESDETARVLAKKYGCSKETIYKTKKGISYAGVS